MKKLIFVFVATLMVACSCEIMPDTDVHYVDEDFVLIERTEGNKVVDGNTRVVRSWVIQRVVVEGDSIMIAEIDDSGCDCIITDELWYSRDVGAVLHFEYIRKDRFNKAQSVAVYDTEYEAVETERSVNPLSITAAEVKETTAISMNKMEVERLILEKEREVMSLEREIEQLKETLK